MIYNKVISSLKDNRDKRLKGEIIALPWSLKRLSKVIPGVEKGKYYLITANPKAGKCLGVDTLIRMHNNSLKKVQDLKVGDKLLNPTSNIPNIITSVCSGIDELYKVNQNYGISYIVNSEHILSLKAKSIKNKKYPNNTIINIPIKEYLQIPKTIRYRLKGYRSDLITFNNKNVNIDPYWLGLWLGDGDKDQSCITNIDQEVIDYIYYYANKLNLHVSKYCSKNRTTRYAIVNKNKAGNYLKKQLQFYKLLYNKHIPIDYKNNSREVILDLLAGIVDSDGSVQYRTSCSIDLCLKEKRLFDDVIDICNSLGFRTISSIRVIGNTNYYRMRISGNNIDQIPLKVKHKKANLVSNKKKDLSTSSLDIQHIGKGVYYGFTLSGNRLFCLQDYTVTHNTQLADYLFLYEPIEWFIKHKPEGKKLKIFYFSLEMSKESKILQAISYKLNKDYNISIAPQNLRSTFEGYVLDEKILSIIQSYDFQSWLKAYESYVIFIDDVRSPDRIHSFIKHYAEKNGTYRYREDGIIEEYIPNHPDEYIIVICDHLSLLSPDNGDTLHAAMYKYSAYHCLEFRDRFKYIVVNVQQQSADSGKQQFDYKGNSIVEKIRPTPDGLADCRLTSRDVNLMLSLFNPFAYHFDEYEDVDLRRLGRWHRELYINLNRDGIANAQVQLYFNGAVNEFMELPRELNNSDYLFYMNKINKVIQ